MKTIFLRLDGIHIDGELMPIEYPVMPIPDIEAVRFVWDEETQSVKQEIIQLADMYKT